MKRRALNWLGSSVATIVAAIALLLVGAFAGLYEEQLYQDQRIRSAHEQADILAANVTAAVAFGDRAAAVELVRTMQVNPEIAAVGVYRSDGGLIASYVRDRASTLPQRSPSESQFFQESRGGVLVPVIQQRTPLGWVYLRPAAEPLNNRLTRYFVLGLLALTVVIVFAGLSAVQRRLWRQSEQLHKANLQLQHEMEERKNAEEALRQSQKMEAIGNLSGGLAHDLNNHLAIVKGNLHLLKKRLAIPETDRHLSASNEGINRAAALTQRVLSFSREQPLTPIRTDLNELIRGMAPLIRSSLRENIAVREDLRASGEVHIDRNQMENVILNLVNNARDAMPAGGSLTIATEDLSPLSASSGPSHGPAPQRVKLSVVDTGSGMSSEVLLRAFDPFFTTKPVGEGTGLGLSTIYGFVQQSGGQVTLESAPERGTTVSILLPRYDRKVVPMTVEDR